MNDLLTCITANMTTLKSTRLVSVYNCRLDGLLESETLELKSKLKILPTSWQPKSCSYNLSALSIIKGFILLVAALVQHIPPCKAANV